MLLPGESGLSPAPRRKKHPLHKIWYNKTREGIYQRKESKMANIILKRILPSIIGLAIVVLGCLWLYGYIGGIRQQEGSVGWQRVLIAPHPVGGVTDCNVSYQTPKGPLKVHWWIEDNQWKIEYSAPKSMQIEIISPADELSRQLSNNN